METKGVPHHRHQEVLKVANKNKTCTGSKWNYRTDLTHSKNTTSTWWKSLPLCTSAKAVTRAVKMTQIVLPSQHNKSADFKQQVPKSPPVKIPTNIVGKIKKTHHKWCQTKDSSSTKHSLRRTRKKEPPSMATSAVLKNSQALRQVPTTRIATVSTGVVSKTEKKCDKLRTIMTLSSMMLY